MVLKFLLEQEFNTCLRKSSTGHSPSHQSLNVLSLLEISIYQRAQKKNEYALIKKCSGNINYCA